MSKIQTAIKKAQEKTERTKRNTRIYCNACLQTMTVQHPQPSLPNIRPETVCNHCPICGCGCVEYLGHTDQERAA